MRKIIGGKKYDTETATCVGSDSYSYPGDFGYWEECLYRKNNGEFFLHGEGGPMTKYAVDISTNETSGSSRITPMSIEEAKEWAEKRYRSHLNVSKLRKLLFQIVVRLSYIRGV